MDNLEYTHISEEEIARDNAKELEKVKNPKDKPVETVYHVESFTTSGKYYQILEYEDGDFQCACPDHFYRHRECKHIRMIKYPGPPVQETTEPQTTTESEGGDDEVVEIKYNPPRYQINEYLEVRLEEGNTKIYVNHEEFMHCKYLLIINPQVSQKQQEIDSIDEAKVYLSNKLETQVTPRDLGLSLREEFWGHCSNLQAWADNDYDTRILHSNLAFPLLKKLTEAGDPVARKVFKDEIAKRIESNFAPVIRFLVQQGYIDLLNETELKYLMQGPAGEKLRRILAQG
ncbi:MAG: hypothetical protein R6U96_18995 [Promethearchaeia archaeon]